MSETAKVTDYEFDTHVWPTAIENWTMDKGCNPSSDADWAEVGEWAVVLRNSYDTGEFEISWRY